MISVFVLRHGEAEMASSNDFDRQLTARGQAQVRESSCCLPDIDLMVVSPYVRAQESALVVQSVMAEQGRRIGSVHNSETLVPDGNVEDVLGWLEDIHASSVLLVSHNPLVTHLSQVLTGDLGLHYGTGSLYELRGDLVAPLCMTGVHRM